MIFDFLQCTVACKKKYPNRAFFKNVTQAFQTYISRIHFYKETKCPKAFLLIQIRLPTPQRH